MVDKVARKDTPLRSGYREHLDNFAHDLQIMSDTVRGLMSSASAALLNASLEDAEATLSNADSLKEIRERCEQRSMQLLALENPVASELRQVVTSIYIVEDFTRMGALARHVANTARLRYPEEVVDKQLQSTVRELAKMVDTMGELIHDQLISPDADLALEMNQIDDNVDDLHRHLLTTVTGKSWEGTNRGAVDVALIGRFYERYADHCVNVAARIVYLVTGLPSEVYAQSRDETPTSEMEERLRNLEQYWRK